MPASYQDPKARVTLEFHWMHVSSSAVLLHHPKTHRLRFETAGIAKVTRSHNNYIIMRDRSYTYVLETQHNKCFQPKD